MHTSHKETNAALQTLAVLEEKEGQDHMREVVLGYIIDTHSKTENNMNSRKAISILTKICLSSFQKALVNLILLLNHFLILARPIWGCVLQYQHSETGKKISNLSSCLFITGPRRTATEQVLASPSGGAPAAKTSPPRQKFSSTRVLWHCLARKQWHTPPPHAAPRLAHCMAASQGTQKPAALCGQTLQRRGEASDHSLWARTDKSRCNEPPHPSPAARVSHQPSHSPCLQPGGAGMSDSVAGPAGFVWLAFTQLASHRASTRFSSYKPPSTRKQKLPKGQETNYWQNHF